MMGCDVRLVWMGWSMVMLMLVEGHDVFWCMLMKVVEQSVWLFPRCCDWIDSYKEGRRVIHLGLRVTFGERCEILVIFINELA